MCGGGEVVDAPGGGPRGCGLLSRVSPAIVFVVLVVVDWVRKVRLLMKMRRRECAPA